MEEALALLIGPLVELNEGQPKLNSDKWPVLKTNIPTVEEWWDSLNHGKICGEYSYLNKIEVGNVSVHLRLMTPNYRSWDCSSKKFTELAKSQQKKLRIIFKEKDNNYSLFDLMGLMGLR
jgi:hypothetical protein